MTAPGGYLYAIRTPALDRARSELHAAGVQAGIHYAIPVRRQASYANLGDAQGDISVSEWAADEVLSLPLYPELTGVALERVAHG
jgi:dTDP-4-amino-4,6-dideoxygalactose transaminase